MKQELINAFIERNLKNFEVNSTGWNELIRQMLFEFAIGGWNIEKDIFGKEKYGELRCYTYSEDKELNTVVKNITQKYAALSMETCEICGNEGKKRSVDSWETTLCLSHYLTQKPVIEIDEELNVRSNSKILLNIKDIVKVDIEYDLQKLCLYTEEPVYGTEGISFSWQEPNYYLLLKTIPLHVFPPDMQNPVSALFENLQHCEICGHKAVHQRSCLRCHQEPWTESQVFIEDYGEKTNYIKACQMDSFIDEDDYEKYFKYDRSFEKSHDHQILFGHHDLKEYEKLLF
ncbi:ribosomal protein L32 [Chryseobacterium rhizosphaerae]|uniref:Ribosomal protein L32 n=1 Tax=Chryseobacterium rhizosphaerae TaxID=395937 RepID=A0AAE4C1L0_9FLAO|nr:hypothetical protein [Chryseobacterium rhizosphaerae]MDR6524644.1 ribosomal protein L32 [Chryseobacterium rhizosphaerae]